MINIIDLNNCKLSDRNGSYGGNAGTKEGIIYNNSNYMVKYPKTTKSMKVDSKELSYTTTPLSEYIGSNIYRILGYDVHETFLGYRNEKIVVACKDFCKHRGDLLEVRTLRNIANAELEHLLEMQFHETGSSHTVDLNEILLHLDYNDILKRIKGVKNRFWDQVVIDGLIGNNDRNNGNWGVLITDKGYVLSPIYDNGAAFYSKLENSRILKRLSNKEEMFSIGIGGNTVFSIDGHPLSYKNILTLDNNALKKSIIKNTELVYSKITDIKNFINSIPESYKGHEVCTKERGQYYFEIFSIKFNHVLLPAYNSIVSQKTNEKSSLLNPLEENVKVTNCSSKKRVEINELNSTNKKKVHEDLS